LLVEPGVCLWLLDLKLDFLKVFNSDLFKEINERFFSLSSVGEGAGLSSHEEIYRGQVVLIAYTEQP